MNIVQDLGMKLAMPIIMGIVEEALTPENFKVYGDKLFDFIEKFVKDSKTTVDDATILPMLAAARAAMGLPGQDK